MINKALFARHGLRMTEQRELIYSTFVRMNGHQSVDSVYNECIKRGLHIGKTTIYRTLNLFVKLKLVDMLAIRGFPVLYETKKEHHHHFVCTKCHNIYDIKGCAIRGYMPGSKFHAKYHDIVFYGICDRCYNSDEKR